MRAFRFILISILSLCGIVGVAAQEVDITIEAPYRTYYVILDLSKPAPVGSGYPTEQVVYRGTTDRWTAPILKPNNPYIIYYVIPKYRLIFSSNFTTPGSGAQFDFPPPPSLSEEVVPALDGSPDTDGDGLHDDTEFVIGTGINNTDTDGDGISDYAEILQGSDPLSGLAVATGVLATAPTSAPAVDVAVLNNVAAVAMGTGGVAVFNVSGALNPVRILEVATPDNAQAVACGGHFVAVADGAAGLAVIDVNDLSNVHLSQQVALGGQATCVATDGYTAYVGKDSGEVVTVDMATGVILDRVNLGSGGIEDLALSGDHLYALSVGTLNVLPLNNASFAVSATVAVPGVRGAGGKRLRLFAGTNLVYTCFVQGFNVVDITNPDAPQVVKQYTDGQYGWKQIVANGSGLALAAVDPVSTGEGADDISLYTLGASGTDPVYQATFLTPGQAVAVAIFDGLGYVADSASGLEVVNYRAYDNKGIPPTIALQASFSLSPGQAEEGKVSRLTAVVTDDVQVRDVEFYVDGVLSQTVGSYPFECRFLTPSRSATKTSFTVQARAVDTGGNSTWSDKTTVNLVADGTPPYVKKVNPQGGGTAIQNVLAFFSEPLAAATVTGSSFTLVAAGPDRTFGTADDVPITSGTVSFRDDLNAASMSFAAPLADGAYKATISTLVTDLAGNHLVKDYSWIFYSGVGDFWIPQAGGLWSNASNWSEGHVPAAGETVTINAPAGSVIDISGSTLVNVNITVTGGAQLIASNGTLLDGVTLGCDLTVGYAITVQNGLTLSNHARLLLGDTNSYYLYAYFQGTQTIAGTGEIVFGGYDTGATPVRGLSVRGDNTPTGGATLTLGAGILVHGSQSAFLATTYASDLLVNQGTIAADTAGKVLAIQGQFTNQGQLVASAGTLSLQSNSFHSTGAGGIALSGTGTLDLGGYFTLANLGPITRTGGTLSVSGTLDNTGQTLALSATTGSLALNGGTIKGGTISATGGAALLLPSNGTLDGVTLAGIDVTVGYAITVQNGLTLSNHARLLLGDTNSYYLYAYFQGTQTIAGTGEIVFGGYDTGATPVRGLSVRGDNTPTGGATLTLGAGILVHGSQSAFLATTYASDLLVNQGTIAADTAGKVLAIQGQFTNQGQLVASAGTLSLQSNSFHSTGAGGIALSGTGTLDLGGYFTLANLGPITRTGGTLSVSGTLDNTGQTLALSATTGSLALNGGTIKGGTISATGGAALLLPSNGTLDGVTLAGIDVTVGYAITVQNGLTLSNHARLLLGDTNSYYLYAYFQGTQTIAGTGEIVFGGYDTGATPVRGLSVRGDNTPTGGATLTLGAGILVHGSQSAFLATTYASDLLVNQGTIAADTAGKVLAIQGQFTNQGQLVASAGTLSLQSNSFHSTGAGGIALSGTGTLDLGGYFTLANLGPITRTGGTLSVSGTLDNTGQTLALSATTGSLALNGGTIKGGTISATGGAALLLPSNGTLDGVTLAGIDVTVGYAITVQNGLTLSNHARLLLGDTNSYYLYAYFQGTQTIAGTGEIVFGGYDTGATPVRGLSVRGDNTPTGGATLTLGAGILVHGSQSAFLATTYASDLLVNQGTIAADTAGKVLAIQGQFTNQGSLQELNGGHILIQP